MALNTLLLGSAGRMGKEAVGAILNDPDLTLSACVAPNHSNEDAATVAGLNTPCGLNAVGSIEEALRQVPNLQVAVDLTVPEAVLPNMKALLAANIAPVIGASGLSSADQAQLDDDLKAANLPGLLVPNFAIGAVLMMQFAQQAAKYFDHAEVIELHHNQKADAPSGTARQTLAMMEMARSTGFATTNAPETELLTGARGAEADGQLRVHSVRLPGLVAHQEVLFGDPGQLLTIRHDSFNRASFMPGVCLALKKVRTLTPGLHVGLEQVMD